MIVGFRLQGSYPDGGALDEACTDDLSWLRIPAPRRSRTPNETISHGPGSADKPRGVRLPAARLLRAARSLGKATLTRTTDVHLCALPLATLLETVGGLHCTLLAGGRLTRSAALRPCAGSHPAVAP